ncbi:hypothetical protein ACFL37_02195 [Candidatus Margulisiibacteriota bacterium]
MTNLHIIQYNVHAEQRYFLGEFRELYNMISLNGNIVSHTPQGVAAFLARANKDFFIDPQTHAFQHPTIHLKRNISSREKGESPRFDFKPSIRKLAESHLQGVFASVLDNDRPIMPADFFSSARNINNEIVAQTCENVVRFQKETLANSLDEEELEFIGEEDGLKPNFIIAPYFYLSPKYYREWLKINLACYAATKAIVNDVPVYLFLVISKEALQKGQKAIIDQLSQIQPDGIFLWIDGHAEEHLTDAEIGNFIKLVKGLRDTTDVLCNYHGGYLSTLLCHSDLNNLFNGVGHSINYGEHRKVVPIGGGIPMARFYFPIIHSRLRFGDGLGIILSKKWMSSASVYRENVCKCPQCTKLIQSCDSVDLAFAAYGDSHPVEFRRRSGTVVRLEYPNSEAKQAAAYHYLYNKAHELREIETKPLSDLLDEMDETFQDISPYVGEDLVDHLASWEKALSKIA